MKILLNRLQKKHEEGEHLTFDIVNHKSIPNTVYSNGTKIGEVTLSTYNAYLSWNRKRLDLPSDKDYNILFQKIEKINDAVRIGVFVDENEFFWSKDFFAFCSKLPNPKSLSWASSVLKGLLEDNIIQPITKIGNSTKYMRV
jgi:hypothetical protein